MADRNDLEAAERRWALSWLRCELSRIEVRVRALELELAIRAAFNPSQPRVPAGHPDGGQWTDGDGGVIPAADTDRFGEDRYLNRHIIEEHVRKTDAELIARMQRETVRRWFISDIMDRNGSFASAENARDLIRRTIDMNPEAVVRVASGRSPLELLTHRFGFVTGKEAYREPQESEIIQMRPTYNVGVWIKHDPNSEFGYRIVTAFPRNFLARIGR